MTPTISVLIPAYGTVEWQDLAWSRAYPSAAFQGAHEVLVHYQPEGDVSSTRNLLAERATGTHLLFLDADDELEVGYVAAMMLALDSAPERSLLTPMVSYLFHGQKDRIKAEPPKFWREVDLRDGNWLIIGTIIPKTLFMEVGGFRKRPIYEDWCLFARCHGVGAEIVKVPDAIYRAHWREDSRNKSMTREERTRAHYEIGRDLFPQRYNDAWLARHLGPVIRTGRARRR
jgi:hypothetical protein